MAHKKQDFVDQPTSLLRGDVEASLEHVLAILDVDYFEQEMDLAKNEEQQRRRRPHASDAYRQELLKDNALELIKEAMATLDMDDMSSLGSSDEESSCASDENDS